MKSTKVITGKLASILQVLLVAALLVSSAVAALAFNVTGTVSNPTGKTGRIYLTVQNTMYGSNSPVAGVSIPAAGTYTIHGLTDPGSYQVSAFADTQGTGLCHANDPIGSSTAFTDTTPSNINFSLALPSPAIDLLPPKEANVIYGDTTATILYKGASDNNGKPIATSYNVYWSTTPNPGPTNMVGGGSVIDLPSGSKDFYVKYGLANPTNQYKFAVTAVLNGLESTPVNANAASPTSGVNVSGTVATSGITLPGGGTHLLMILIDQSSNNFITYSLPNPTNSQVFTISGVPPGSYSLYTIIDRNNNGLIDLGDIFDTDIGVSVTVGTSDVTGVAVALTAADARAYVQTRHYSGDTYSLSLGAATMLKRPVNVTVSGPQIPTMDLPLSSNDNGIFETWRNVGSRPVFPASPDTYSFAIEYSSGSGSSPLSAPITGIVDSFSTPTAPTGVIAFPAPDPLQFSWTAASPTPGYPYTYSFRLNNPFGYFNNDPYWNMPSSTTSINIPGTDFTPQQGTNYSWNISVKDANGNSSESNANFSAGGSGSISGMVTSDGSHGIPNTYVILLDSGTQKPVSGIPAVQTDSNSGLYFIGNVPSGNYYVYFSAGPGYQSQYYNNVPTISGATQLVVTNGSSTNGVNALLVAAPNTGTIVGRVVNASTEQPVVGALVELYSTNNSPLGNSVFTTSSGDFQISTLNPGSYKLRISANGYKPILAVTQYLVQSGVTSQVSISLPNTVTYTSRVVDSAVTPAPVANALVEVVGGTISALTDSNGYFTITVPFSTSFYLRISKATYVTTYTATMSYSQDSDTSDRPYPLLTTSDYDSMFTPTSPNSVAKIAETGSISARVASAGNPLMTLPGATVTASDGTTSYPVCYYNSNGVNCNGNGGQTTTGANGRFYVLNVPDGKQITVTVAKGGYNGGSRTFPVVADSASLSRVGMQTSAPSYTMISKLVNFTTSVPIANNTVTLFKDDNTTVGQVNTDSNGLFTAADLLSGTNYYLKVSDGTSFLESYSANTASPGSNVDRSGRPYYAFSLSPNQLTTWGFGNPPTNAVITGTIKDGLSGQPIAGARITAKYTANNSPITSIAYDDGTGKPGNPATYISTSASNGRFYIYGISSSDIATKVTVTVQTDDTTGYDFRNNASKDYHVLNGKLTQGSFNFPSLFLTPMVNINGTASDLYSLPISGARVVAYILSPTWSMINNPALTDSTGKFSMQVPSGTPFALELISFGKRTAYSQDIQVSQNTNLPTFPLLTNNDYSLLGWPVTAGKTFIRGMAMDNLARPLDGVFVAPTPGSYTINYVNDADNRTLMTGGATFTNGLFVLKDATPSDFISLTASKTGKSFYPISFSHMVADTDSLGGAFDSTPTPGSFNFPAPTVNFGGINLQASSQQLVTINNNGPNSITVSNYGLTGNSGDFSIMPGGTCATSIPATLTPGGCTLMISFVPTTTGTRTATLNINSNAASGSNYTISLTGTGLATAPGTPTIYNVTPWDGQATVNFNPSAFDGGSPIQWYTVTATPGPFTYNGSGSPITVYGMSNGQTYTFTVTATNFVGTSLSSNPVDATPFYAPLRIGSTGYANNLQTLLAIAAADSTITAQAGSVTVTTPPLTLTQGITISGGYNNDYSAVSAVNGFTTIPGRVNIKAGALPFKVIFKNIRVK